MDASVPVVCGIASTAIFVIGTLPMLAKAVRTRDLSSYSVGNIVLANVGNGFNSVYVLSLPPGPVWALHGFNALASALMLYWYVRFRPRRAQKYPDPIPGWLDSSPDAIDLSSFIASSETASGDERHLVSTRGG